MSIKELKSKPSMLFNLVFAKNNILSCFFFLFLNYWLKLFNCWVIAEIFNPIAEHIIPTGVLTKETKAEMEIHPVTAKLE